MKYNFFSTKVSTLSLLLTLSACASLPSHLIVSPDVMVTPDVSYQNKQAQLSVVDMRTTNHVVQILRDGEAATLLSAQESLEQTIEKKLSTHWQKQGLVLDSNAINNIDVAIEKAVISVNQQTMEYKVQTEIVLKVTIENDKQTLTITFQNRGNSDGPLQADIAVLERNFNQRLAKLLTQILASEKITNFLK